MTYKNKRTTKYQEMKYFQYNFSVPLYYFSQFNS